MNVYVFENVEKLTDSYHCDGGLVVVAQDKEEVMQLIKVANKYDDLDNYKLASADIELSDEDWKNAIVYPTYVNTEPRIMVFPDAGCC